MAEFRPEGFPEARAERWRDATGDRNKGRPHPMTETLIYIAIYLLIGWLMVEGAIASKEEDELLARVLSMYPKPTPWDRFIGKLYLLQYIVGWPYYLFRNLILILIDLYNSRRPPTP